MTLVDISVSELGDFVEKVARVKGDPQLKACVPGVLRYGWAIDSELVGVSVFDNGMHPMRQGVFGPDYYANVLHYHKWVLKPGLSESATSQFVYACLEQIPKG